MPQPRDKETAVKLSQELVARLNKKTGGKWRPRVWNAVRGANPEWHYSAKCGNMTVHAINKRNYWCVLLYNKAGMTTAFNDSDATATTPEGSIVKQLSFGMYCSAMTLKFIAKCSDKVPLVLDDMIDKHIENINTKIIKSKPSKK